MKFFVYLCTAILVRRAHVTDRSEAVKSLNQRSSKGLLILYNCRLLTLA